MGCSLGGSFGRVARQAGRCRGSKVMTDCQRVRFLSANRQQMKNRSLVLKSIFSTRLLT